MALSGFATFGLRVLASSLVNAVTIFLAVKNHGGRIGTLPVLMPHNKKS